MSGTARDAKKIYLGDGAYAEFNGVDSVTITAENGIRATDRVVLGPNELIALLHFVQQCALELGVDIHV